LSRKQRGSTAKTKIYRIIIFFLSIYRNQKSMPVLIVLNAVSSPRRSFAFLPLFDLISAPQFRVSVRSF